MNKNIAFTLISLSVFYVFSNAAVTVVYPNTPVYVAPQTVVIQQSAPACTVIQSTQQTAVVQNVAPQTVVVQQPMPVAQQTVVVQQQPQQIVVQSQPQTVIVREPSTTEIVVGSIAPIIRAITPLVVERPRYYNYNHYYYRPAYHHQHYRPCPPRPIYVRPQPSHRPHKGERR